MKLIITREKLLTTLQTRIALFEKKREAQVAHMTKEKELFGDKPERQLFAGDYTIKQIDAQLRTIRFVLEHLPPELAIFEITLADAIMLALPFPEEDFPSVSISC